MPEPIFWTFERPINLNATVPANITWLPRTFDTANLGNFSLNLWLLREDNRDVIDLVTYPARLLFGEAAVISSREIIKLT